MAFKGYIPLDGPTRLSSYANNVGTTDKVARKLTETKAKQKFTGQKKNWPDDRTKLFDGLRTLYG